MAFCTYICIYLIVTISLWPNVYGQGYFTLKQKNSIIQQHKQRLANEAMKMFENQFRMDRNDNSRYGGQSESEMFNQMFNYKGLYENLIINNVTVKRMSIMNHIQDYQNDSIIGFDYKHFNNKHFICFYFRHKFIVNTFHLNGKNIVYDHHHFIQSPVIGKIKQIKLHRIYYHINQLYLIVLMSINGFYEIRSFQVIDHYNNIEIDEKQLLYSSKLYEQINSFDIFYDDHHHNSHIVILIDSGWKQLNQFKMETNNLNKNDEKLIKITIQNALRVRTFRVQTDGLLLASNTTHWCAYHYHDDRIESINWYRMKYPINDMQTFSNAHRYYVGISTSHQQYIYQWKNFRQGFQGVARINLSNVYKMNALSLSYSREDNFFYFDQTNNDLIKIYGYDITNGVFVLLKTISKQNQLNISSSIHFDRLYSISFYDKNRVFQLRLTDQNELYLFLFETSISNESKSTRATNNLKRYNKQLYEQKIEKITRNLFRLDQQETISKLATNLTLLFNVTFRANVRVGHYQIINQSESKLENILINNRNYAINELSTSMNVLRTKLEHITQRMAMINSRIKNDVIYRDQNVHIYAHKYVMNNVNVKKIYSKQTLIDSYNGQLMHQLLANIFRIGKHSDQTIFGRKIFKSITMDNQRKSLRINQLNGYQLNELMYSDLNQNIYSTFWYTNRLFVDRLELLNQLISNTISMANLIHINQADYANKSITIYDKIVFDSLNVENLLVNYLDQIRMDKFAGQILLNHNQGTIQPINVATKIDKLIVQNDIFINYINNHNLTFYLQNIISRNQNIRFANPIKLMSNVKMNMVNVQQKVNNIQIPDDLVDRHSNQVINGRKHFKWINVDNINVTYLNNMQIPIDVVTLTGNDELIEQDLQLDRLIVNGNVNVRGLYDGVNLTHLDERYLDSFRNVYQNLSFLAPVNVSKLIVLSDNVNNIESLQQLYSNVYFETERTLKITGEKTIDNLLRCDSITVANTINQQQSFDDFVSLRNGNDFTENVIFSSNATYFEHINLLNTINGHHVNDLLDNVITLSGYQSISGDQHFADGIRVLGNLKIFGTINDRYRPDNWLRYSTMQDINSPLNLNAPIYCKMAIRDGNINARRVNNDYFENQTADLLMLNRPQTLNINIQCINCSASNIQTNSINNNDLHQFLNNYLSKTKYQIINATDSIQMNDKQRFYQINTKNNVAGIDLRTLKYQALNIDGYNIITKPLIIHGHLIFEQNSQLLIEQWNNVNFNSFINIIVRKNSHEKIKIQGDLLFNSDVDILADFHVKTLNNYVPENVILLNNRDYTIYNTNIIFNENMIISKNLTVIGFINQFNLTKLDEMVLKKNANNEIIVSDKGNDKIIFIDSFKTHEIIVHGHVDNIQLNSESIIFKNLEQNIKKLTFNGPIRFDKNVNIMSHINHLDKNYLNRIILIKNTNQDEQHIDYHKTFNQISVKEIHHYNGFINFKVINSINLQQLNSSLLYPNHDYIVNSRQPIRFMNNVTILNTHFRVLGLINNIHINDIIRMDRQRQVITGKKIIDSIVFNENLDVQGYLNTNVDIKRLYKQMFLVYGNQHIKTPITFVAPVYLMNSNNTINSLNNYNPNDLIQLNGNQIMINYDNHSTINFDNIIAQKLFIKNHLVNNINLTDIHLNAFIKIADNHHHQQNNVDTIQHFQTLTIDDAYINANLSIDNHMNDLDLSQTIDTIKAKFDPNIDSQRIQQQFYLYQTALNQYEYIYENLNFEIDYFHYYYNHHGYYSNEMDQLLIDSLYFQQKFKIFNSSANFFDYFYKRKHYLWQTIVIRNQMIVFESYENNQFRLIHFDQITSKSWVIFEKRLPSGLRPFIFTMNDSIYIIYFDHFNDQIYDCLENYGTKLYHLIIDYGSSNYTEMLLQSFTIEKIINIGHYALPESSSYHQSTNNNVHYLVFNTYDSMDPVIKIYQKTNIDCRFQLFQTIPLHEPVYSLSLFTIDLSSADTNNKYLLKQLFMATLGESWLYIWKQEGIHGFMKNWIIYLDSNYNCLQYHHESYRKSNQIHPFIFGNNRFIIRLQHYNCSIQSMQSVHYEAKFSQKFDNNNHQLLKLNLFLYNSL